VATADDDDKDFDDFDQENAAVPDENTKVEQIKSMGLNPPKNQLHNSIG